MSRAKVSKKRGRTREKRLTLLDSLFASSFFELPPRGQAIDLGYGDAPLTTLAWAKILKRTASQLRVLGVENEPSRVRSAEEKFADQDVRFLEGGFDLSALNVGPVAVIRCMNVLRGYALEEVTKAQRQMLEALTPGGLLLEGSTDTEGHLLSVHCWRRTLSGTAYEGLILATDFCRGFSPRMFRDVLPRDLRRHVRDGEAIHDFLEHFEQITTKLRTQHSELGQLFVAAGTQLMRERSDTCGSALLHQGTICWRPERPSLRPEVLQPR